MYVSITPAWDDGYKARSSHHHYIISPAHASLHVPATRQLLPCSGDPGDSNHPNPPHAAPTRPDPPGGQWWGPGTLPGPLKRRTTASAATEIAVPLLPGSIG